MCPIVPAMHASACLLALCAVSAPSALTLNTDSFIQNCFMDNAMCEYYANAESILRGGDVSRGDPKIRVVDEMLYDYADIASKPPMYKDCVPFISEYSDCSIENICLGCTICHCDMLGRWNCSQVQKCRPDPELVVDHRILTIVMEHLLEEDKFFPSRIRRSTGHLEENIKNHKDFSKWMFGISPFDFEDDINNTQRSYDNEIRRTTTKATIAPEFLNFEQFLIDVGYDSHLDVHEDNDAYSTKINNSSNKNVLQRDSTSNYKDFVDMLEKLSSVTDSVSTTNFRQNNTLRDVQYNNDDDYKSEIPIGGHTLILSYLNEQNDVMNEIILPHNMTKREILRTNAERNYTKNESIAIFIKNVTENSFYPLDNIVKVKQEELKELINIRDNLLGSINAYSGVELSNFTNSSTSKKSDLRFIIYKLDSSLNYSLKSNNQSLQDKYQMKLKTDINEVVKDINVIQRLPKSSNVVHELKYLIRALEHYVKYFPENNIKIHNLVNSNTHFRRYLSNNKKIISNPILFISTIFEYMDKNMPQGNVLSLLSENARKLLKRIIDQLYFDDLGSVQSKLKDQHYNLANNLQEIGNKWQYQITDINNCIPSEKLYKLKLFHLKLSADIYNLKDILTLLGFAGRRRMSLINDLNSEKVVMDNLIKIHNTIKQIAKMTNKPAMRKALRPNHRKIKQGFLQKVKRLLKKSKQEIRGILMKKTATSDVIKQIAKKRLDDIKKKKLSRYEDTMYRWQDNLNIVPRIKRSANEFNNFLNRVKHIIPGYLHKKVKPAMDSKKKNKNGSKNVTRQIKKQRRHRTTRKPRKHQTTTTMRTRTEKMRIVKHPKHH